MACHIGAYDAPEAGISNATLPIITGRTLAHRPPSAATSPEMEKKAGSARFPVGCDGVRMTHASDATRRAQKKGGAPRLPP